MFRLFQRLFAQRIFTASRVCSRSVHRSQCAHSSRYLLGAPLVLAFSLPFLRGKTPEEELREAWALGLHFLHVGELARAEERLHAALKVLTDQFSRGELTEREFQSRRARVCSELANLALLRGETKQAEGLLRATMRDCVGAGLEQRGPAMVEMSLKLAQIMAAGGRSTEAETGFRFCVDAMRERVAKEAGDEDEVKNDRALHGICAAAYGKFLQTQGRFAEALGLIRTALTEARRVYDDVNPVVVSLMTDEAVLRTEVGELEEAEKSFWAAIEIAEFRPDILLPLLPPLYVNLGALLLRANRLHDAEEMIKTAQRLLKDMPPEAGNEEAGRQAAALIAKIADVKAKNLKKSSV